MKDLSDKTVIIFNAPPESGKDTAVKFMFDYFQTGKILEFKDELYNDVAEYFNITKEQLLSYHLNRFLKEEPCSLFPKYKHHGNLWNKAVSKIYNILGVILWNHTLLSYGNYSSREALIHVSENVIKPSKGKDYYGNKLVEKIYENLNTNYFFVSDGGFKEEIVPILNTKANVIIINIERKNCSFSNDSRTLLTPEMFKDYNNIRFVKIMNNGTLDILEENIVNFSYDLVTNMLENSYDIQSEYEVVYC